MNTVRKTVEEKVVRKLTSDVPKRRTGVGSRVLGPGDDAAILAPRRDHQTILTCDWFLEGRHFVRDTHPPVAVGWKCVARAVSDIAAMGAQPRCILLSLALPETATRRWLTEFARGVKRACNQLGCPLVGGDTTRDSRILINVTVVGEASPGQAICRSGAQPGDLIYVSGRLGEADLGLQVLRGYRRRRVNKNKKDAILRKHLYPEPRIALGRWLAVGRIATAMMDLSDGLSTDLPRLCSASGVGAQIEAAKIPVVNAEMAAKVGSKRFDPLGLALNGGDDYELLFAVNPRKARQLPRSFRGLPLTSIGKITRERRLTLVQQDGREVLLRSRGWNPFRK
jgi:thiamine-monophosphate kinase